MYQFSYKINNFEFLGPNLPKMDIWVKTLKIYIWTWNQHSSDTMCTNFLTKQTTLTFLGSNLPKNGFWGSNLKNLSLDSDSTPLCSPIFSQNRQLLSFWPKFGGIAQLRAMFWFKYC